MSTETIIEKQVNALKNFRVSLENGDIKIIKEKFVELLKLNISATSSTTYLNRENFLEQKKLELLFERCIELFIKDEEYIDNNSISRLLYILNYGNANYKMKHFIEENFNLIVNSDFNIDEMPKIYMGKIARERKKQELINKHRNK